MIGRSAVAVTAVALAVLVLAGPVEAAQAGRVAPLNGKWAGMYDTTSCDSVASPEITDSSTPDELDCALPVTGTTELVDFRLANRRVTSLSFDIVIQCHASDTDRWTSTVMSFRSAPGWGYSPLPLGSRSAAIPASGVLRLLVPVEESVQYPAGEVRATFDFRGQTAKVALFYEGTYIEPGFSNHCISSQNRPSVIPVRRRA